MAQMCDCDQLAEVLIIGARVSCHLGLSVITVLTNYKFSCQAHHTMQVSLKIFQFT